MVVEVGIGTPWFAGMLMCDKEIQGHEKGH